MNRYFWTAILALALLATACAPAATPTPLPTIALDAETAAVETVKASAEVVPAQDAELGFVISGLVKEVLVEEGQQVQAGQALVALDTTDLEFAVTAAEADLRAAELDAAIQRYRRKYTNDAGRTVYLSGPREQILKADAKVAQKQAALETAKASLAQGTLAAPFAGAVIVIDVKPGEYVQPGQAVIVLADLANLQIETTDLGERNVATVATGQPASVYVEALDKEFPGKVSRISPISETIGGDVVFRVTVQLDEQPPALLWGMSADVEINVE
ncbi:MAG: efflux RND transporter periplasmic adaptor subunit [Chloroflexota bacterium]